MPVTIPEGEYVAVPEATKRAGVNSQRIRALCASGQIGAIRIGEEGGPTGYWLIPVTGLDRWVATRQTGRPRTTVAE